MTQVNDFLLKLTPGDEEQAACVPQKKVRVDFAHTLQLYPGTNSHTKWIKLHLKF